MVRYHCQQTSFPKGEGGSLKELLQGPHLVVDLDPERLEHLREVLVLCELGQRPFKDIHKLTCRGDRGGPSRGRHQGGGFPGILYLPVDPEYPLEILF